MAGLAGWRAGRIAVLVLGVSFARIASTGAQTRIPPGAQAGRLASADAQETVSVSVPLAVSFQVSDVSQSTAGTPSPTRLSFSNATLNSGKALRISVQADTAAFTPPSGPGIPASHVSWNNLGASGGAGVNGTLSASAYALVYQSDPSRISGHVDLGWTLAAPGSGIRAGSHQLTIRWRFESITP